MTVIVDVHIPPDQFALGELVAGTAAVSLRFERVIPLGEHVLPFFWVEGDATHHVEAILTEHPGVESFDLIVAVDDRQLYRAEWSSDIDGVISSLRETEGTILEGAGTTDYWEFRLRFVDHDRFQEFLEQCDQKRIDVEVRAVFQRQQTGSTHGISDTQLETLLVAYEKGFFDVPREVSMRELADYFGISQQAISQRLRRGTANMIEENYVPG